MDVKWKFVTCTTALRCCVISALHIKLLSYSLGPREVLESSICVRSCKLLEIFVMMCSDAESAITGPHCISQEARVWWRPQQQAYKGIPAACRGTPEGSERLGEASELNQN